MYEEAEGPKLFFSGVGIGFSAWTKWKRLCPGYQPAPILFLLDVLFSFSCRMEAASLLQNRLWNEMEQLLPASSSYSLLPLKNNRIQLVNNVMLDIAKVDRMVDVEAAQGLGYFIAAYGIYVVVFGIWER